jgi:hypothetical protein
VSVASIAAALVADTNDRPGDVSAGTIGVVSIIVGTWVALAVVCWIFWRARRSDGSPTPVAPAGDGEGDGVGDPAAARDPEERKERLQWRSARSS